MSKLIKYMGILWQVLLGNVMKLKVWFDVYVRRHVSLSEAVVPNLIVSLTSYGKRVSGGGILYTLHSLITQKRRPERIILWLGQDEFSDSNLPAALRFIMKYGVEVHYCKDIRSYTKLLPTLILAPEYDVITVDDDIYYGSNLVDVLYTAHEQNPDCIVSMGCRIIEREKNGELKPYALWRRNDYMNQEFRAKYVVALGVYGVLYPAGILGNEVLQIDLARKLCPQADDLWFFIIGLRRGLDKYVCRFSKVSYFPTDLIRQTLTRDRLFAENVSNNANDEQLANLLSYFGIDIAEWTTLPK